MAALLLHRARVASRPYVPTALRPAVSRVFLTVAGLALRGDGVACPCCGRHYRRFLLYPSRLCPGCRAYERQRALALLLTEEPHLLPAGGRLLHVGPEPSLQPTLRNRAGSYAAVDLAPRFATLVADVRELPFGDASFEGIVCLHVLVELPDPVPALEELARVTAPGGRAVLQEPEPLASRLPDLARADWEVRPLRVGEALEPLSVRRHDLDDDEVFYVCIRRS